MTRMRPCIIVVLLFLVGHASIANADAGTDARSAGTTSAIGWVKRKNQTIVKKTVHSNRFSSDTVLTRRRALLKCRGGGGGGRGGNVACRAGRTAGFPLPAAKEWAARAWGRVQQPALPKTSSAEVVVRGGEAHDYWFHTGNTKLAQRMCGGVVVIVASICAWVRTSWRGIEKDAIAGAFSDVCRSDAKAAGHEKVPLFCCIVWCQHPEVLPG